MALHGGRGSLIPRPTVISIKMRGASGRGIKDDVYSDWRSSLAALAGNDTVPAEQVKAESRLLGH